MIRGVFEEAGQLDISWTLQLGGGTLGPEESVLHSPEGEEIDILSLASLAGASEVVNFNLEATNEGGYRVCRDVDFFLQADGSVDASVASVEPQIFSPNGDGVFDATTLSLTSFEPTVASIELLIPGRPNRILADNLPIEGAIDFVWDGRDGNGVPVVDSVYSIQTALRDGCGNERVSSLSVEVDTTAPTARIDYPVAGEPLTMILEVFGEASDRNLHQWFLEYGIGTNPVDWSVLASGAGNTNSLPLSSWNTFGLQGEVTLRLRAVDVAGNSSVTDEILNIQTPAAVLSSLEAVPTLFSPNGDGRIESTSARFGLEAEATVDLLVTTESGALVRTLRQDALLSPGAHLESWDGLLDDGSPAPDGLYLMRAEAELASNPLISQAEQVSVVLDRTGPTLVVNSPLGPFEPKDILVAGSVSDIRLVELVVEMTDDPSSPTWIELYRGPEERLDFLFATLTDLDEGPYTLRFEARDEALIRTERTIDFTVDSTPPSLTLEQPEESVLGTVGGPVDVLASLEEENLDRFHLEWGVGLDPSAWTEILSGDELPVPVPLLSWDLAGLVEGPGVLRWRAVDLAGNEAMVSVPLIIDNTPPVALLSEPLSEAFVTAPTPVVGTATDLNLESYRLEVAPGAIGESNQFSELSLGTQSVSDGLLTTWSALPADGRHTLRLTVVDAAGNSAEDSVEVRVDTHAPEPPTGLVGVVENGFDVVLTWIASESSDVVGYLVQKNGEELFPDPRPELTLDDLQLEDGTYVYSAIAVDEAGWRSVPSEPAVVVVDTSGGIASIFDPRDGDRVGGIVEILGTATGREFGEYRVAAEIPSGSGSWLLLRQSTVDVVSDLLAEWSTVGLPEETAVTLRLEVEEETGHVETETVQVTIDNLPPAAPVGLAAVATGDDIQVTWTPNAEADLDGYLLYRDGVLVNADGPVIGNLSNYLLTDPLYDDIDRPDGTFVYEVYALDLAGNQSPPSAPAEATVDERAPSAEIVDPEDATEFDGELVVRADSPDTDIAQVLFEYREEPGGVWTALGPADLSAPWATVLDPGTLGIPYGDYRLRAIATDLGGQTDASPTSIGVTYSDLTPPDPVVNLVARVDGGEVTLTWEALVVSDLAGYLAERESSTGEIVSLTPVPITETTLVDSGVPDGSYDYRVWAIDDVDNEGEPSEAVALVHTPELTQPWTPTFGSSTTLVGQGLPAWTATGEISNPSNAPPVWPLPDQLTDLTGTFAWTSLPIPLGENTLLVALTDAEGNRSRERSVRVVRGEIPTSPTGLAAGPSGPGTVSISWNPNPEADLLGYRLLKNDLPLPAEVVVTVEQTTASSEIAPTFSSSRVIDGDPATYWLPSAASNSGEWVHLSWPEPQLLHRVELEWEDGGNPGDYDLEAWSGFSWVTLLEIRGSVELLELLPLPLPYRTNELRLTLRSDLWSGLDEFRAIAHPLITETTLDDTVADGRFRYSAIAVSTLGFESAPSAEVTVEIGDVEAPEPVVLTALATGSDVQLSWPASVSGDVDHYELFRGGESIAVVAWNAALSFLDTGLVNGTYLYTVEVVDGAGNRSVPSNEASATVAAAPLGPPRNLTAVPNSPVPSIQTEWLEPLGATPDSYRLLRGLASGGPYVTVTETTQLSHEDTSIAVGSTYYYVVAGLDLLGNEGEHSNEVSVGLVDLEAPLPPTLHRPTIPGFPVWTHDPAVDISGSAEPSSTVTLSLNGTAIASTTARAETESNTIPFMVDWAGRVSPDGLWITDGYDQLLNLETEAVSTMPVELDNNERWFPDATRFVTALQDRLEIYDVVTGVLQTIPVVLATHAAPSPDGLTLAVLGENEGLRGLLLLDLTSGTWSALSERFDMLSMRGWTLTWSRDGSKIAYVHSQSGVEFIEVGSGAETIVGGLEVYEDVEWSPDGRQLAFVGEIDSNQQVQIYDLESGSTTPFTSFPDWHGGAIWSPDGEWIAYWENGASLQRRRLSDGLTEIIQDTVFGYWSRMSWVNDRGVDRIDRRWAPSIQAGGRVRLPGNAPG